jgi:quinol monooxygenase YgiN
MLIVVARYVIAEGHTETVVRLMRANAAASRQEPGCLAFSVYQDADDPSRILLYEEYTDEDAFQRHRRTPHFREIVEAQVAPLLDQRTWTRLAPLHEPGE